MTIATSTTQPAAGEVQVVTKGGGRKRTIMVLVLLLAVGGAAYWFMLRPAEAKPAPEPGEVVRLEPIQVNLQGGHYLKIGIALQLTAEAHEADGAAALDAAIDLFSGKPMNQLGRAEVRSELKKALMKELKHDYHGEVMGVYFTDFVTQ